jgi:4-amino-4-deoxy-L-arabinose transferase-like glycosyltransferase
MQRFMQGVNHHGGRPWWYGLAVVAVMYFPWSLSLPAALLQSWPWRQSKSMAKRYQNLPLFAASWLIAGFLLFALSSSQVNSFPISAV